MEPASECEYEGIGGCRRCKELSSEAGANARGAVISWKRAIDADAFARSRSNSDDACT